MDVRDATPQQNRTTYAFLQGGGSAIPYTPFFSPREVHRYIYQGENTLLRTIDTTYNEMLNGTTTARSLPTQITTTLNDSNQVSRVEFDYDSYVSNTVIDGFPFHRPVATTQPIDNVSAKREYDYGPGAVGNLLRTTASVWSKVNPINGQDYTASPVHIMGLKTSEQILDSSVSPAVVVAQTQYEYDNYGGSNPLTTSGAIQHDASHDLSYITRGNATAIKRWRNTDGAFLATKNQYDDTGNIVKNTDPLNHSTQFSYADSWADASCAPASGTVAAFPTRVTNALNQFSTATYNSCTGTLATATDPNNLTTTFNYDLMDRRTQTNRPDGGQTSTCFSEVQGSTCYSSSLPISIVTTEKINSAANKVTAAVFDGLGRMTQTQLNSDPDCSSGDKTDTTYDALGRVYTVSNPYCTTGDSTYGITTFNYDALGRTTQVTHPDNTTVLTTYTGRAKQVQDEGNGTQRVTRISQTDGLGRVKLVCEVSSVTLLGNGGTPSACGQDIPGTGFLTTYAYDVLHNLTSVSMTGLNPRTFAYDSLSRLTSATNPESGTITYAYDPNGNVITKTDGRGITTCFGDWTGTTCNGSTGYDALNRLLKKTYSDGTPAATFNYDQSSALGVSLTNTIGRKSSQSTAGPNATGSVFSYDQMGRISNNSQCTPQNCGTGIFSFQYTQYDFLGNLVSATNATGVTFSYSYTPPGSTMSAGRLIGIDTNFVDGSHPGSLFSNAHYAPFV